MDSLKEGRNGDKFVLKAKAFLKYLDYLSYKNPPSGITILTAAVMPAKEVGLALEFAGQVSHSFGSIKPVPKVWRSDIAPVATEKGSSFVYKHATHPSFSSWTTINLPKKPGVLKELETQRSSVKGTRLVILESTDLKGKLVWSPDSMKLLPKLIKACTAAEKALPKGSKHEGLYSDIAYTVTKVLNQLKLRKEQEVILYHPSGMRVTCTN